MFFFQSARVDVYFKLFLISVFQRDYLQCFSPCVCFLNGKDFGYSVTAYSLTFSMEQGMSIWPAYGSYSGTSAADHTE